MVLIFLNYHSVYKYIYKSETQTCYSKDYSNLKDVGSPLTKKSTQALCAGQKKSINKTNESVVGSSKSSCSKTKRLSNLDVADFSISSNIQRVVELRAVTQECKKEGQKDLVNFIYSKLGKSLPGNSMSNLPVFLDVDTLASQILFIFSLFVDNVEMINP